MRQGVREFRHTGCWNSVFDIMHHDWSGMVLTDHNIAICWVWVAYIVKLCVCVRYMVVWWCAEVANCPSARVLNAGAFAARAVCGGVVLQFGRLLRWFGI